MGQGQGEEDTTLMHHSSSCCGVLLGILFIAYFITYCIVNTAILRASLKSKLLLRLRGGHDHLCIDLNQRVAAVGVICMTLAIRSFPTKEINIPCPAIDSLFFIVQTASFFVWVVHGAWTAIRLNPRLREVWLPIMRRNLVLVKVLKLGLLAVLIGSFICAMRVEKQCEHICHEPNCPWGSHLYYTAPLELTSNILLLLVLWVTSRTGILRLLGVTQRGFLVFVVLYLLCHSLYFTLLFIVDQGVLVSHHELVITLSAVVWLAADVMWMHMRFIRPLRKLNVDIRWWWWRRGLPVASSKALIRTLAQLQTRIILALDDIRRVGSPLSHAETKLLPAEAACCPIDEKEMAQQEVVDGDESQVPSFFYKWSQVQAEKREVLLDFCSQTLCLEVIKFILDVSKYSSQCADLDKLVVGTMEHARLTDTVRMAARQIYDTYIAHTAPYHIALDRGCHGRILEGMKMLGLLPELDGDSPAGILRRRGSRNSVISPLSPFPVRPVHDEPSGNGAVPASRHSSVVTTTTTIGRGSDLPTLSLLFNEAYTCMLLYFDAHILPHFQRYCGEPPEPTNEAPEKEQSQPTRAHYLPPPLVTSSAATSAVQPSSPMGRPTRSPLHSKRKSSSRVSPHSGDINCV